MNGPKLNDPNLIFKLTEAARVGDIKKMADILNLGVSVDSKDSDTSSLSGATLYNQKEAAEFLIMRGADLNVRSSSGYTPLHLAVFHSDIDLFKLLLRQKANPRIRRGGGSLGDTPKEMIEKHFRQARDSDAMLNLLNEFEIDIEEEKELQSKEKPKNP